MRYRTEIPKVKTTCPVMLQTALSLNCRLHNYGQERCCRFVRPACDTSPAPGARVFTWARRHGWVDYIHWEQSLLPYDNNKRLAIKYEPQMGIKLVSAFEVLAAGTRVRTVKSFALRSQDIRFKEIRFPIHRFKVVSKCTRTNQPVAKTNGEVKRG